MIIAGTGHRPDKLGGYGRAVKRALFKVAYDWLKKNKPAKVISGMALGWDQALALAAIKLKIPVIAAVPFKGQEAAWPMQAQTEYNRILAACSEIVIVSEGGYSANKMHIRNEWMVDNCTTVLALYNGTYGGTASCIKYAKLAKKDIVNLWAEYGLSL